MSLVDWLLDPTHGSVSTIEIVSKGPTPPELRWVISARPGQPEGPPLAAPSDEANFGAAMISVSIPARNEGMLVRETIRDIHASSFETSKLEFCIADDASSDELGDPSLETDLAAEGIRIKVARAPQRLGVAGARNLAASLASGEILVATDAHVRFSRGWDAAIRTGMREDTIYAGQIREEGTYWRAYGCRFAFPQMGTTWVREEHAAQQPVAIAASPATAMTRATFVKNGGFDSGMIVYGAAEPEFSVRAWLLGMTVRSLPEFTVWHRFRPKAETQTFLTEMRPNIAHNALRFALLYLNGRPLWEAVRYYARTAPDETAAGLALIRASSLRERRAELHRRFTRNIEWFARELRASGDVALWQEMMGLAPAKTR